MGSSREIDFIAVATHELLSPVASLILANGILLDGAAGPLNREQREIVETQRAELQRLDHLIRELLDISRLTTGAILPVPERISVVKLTQDPVESLKIQAKNKGVTLTSEVDSNLPDVKADRLQIGRVLTNLMVNAVRHTPPGGTVKVRAEASENDVTLSVEDTGEGIPEEYRKRIFEKFVQVPGATQGSAGLGLSIARTIVHAHSGEMSVESEIGKGSSFRFTLPLADTPTGGEIKV